MEIIHIFYCGYFCRAAFQTALDSYCCLTGGTKLKRSVTYGYFTFQTIIDIAGEHANPISSVVCVGSPVMIIILQKVNKQVHKKFRNFQLE